MLDADVRNILTLSGLAPDNPQAILKFADTGSPVGDAGVSAVNTLNFTGSGVSAAVVGGVLTVTINSGGDNILEWLGW